MTNRSRPALVLGAAALLSSAACTPVVLEGGAETTPRPTTESRGSERDTTALIPAGFGTLRQDDLAIRVTVQGLSVRAIPLDESFIRTLSPDSYRAVRDIGESKREDIDAIVRRTGLQSVSVWYVSFFNVQQGEARFTAQDVILTNMGRDFRPLDIVPITPGFGNQRLRQREQAHALYVFDGAINANQSIALTIESQSGGDWRTVMQRVERERALIRSRAAAGQRPPPER
jgi:hypothetical protein